jgi:hypothetical protein
VLGIDFESTNAFIKTEANVQYEWRDAFRSHFQYWSLLEPDLHKYLVYQLNLNFAHRRRMQSNLFAVFAPQLQCTMTLIYAATRNESSSLKQICRAPIATMQTVSHS